MQFSNLLALLIFLIPPSFYTILASDVAIACMISKSIQESVAGDDESMKLENWLNEPENICLLVSEPEYLIYLMKHSYEKFFLVVPFILDYLNEACRLYFDEDFDYSRVPFFWPPIKEAILQYAKIEHLKMIFGSNKWKSLRVNNGCVDCIKTIRACSKRACFSLGKLDEQRKEVDVFVDIGILDVSPCGIFCLIHHAKLETRIPEVLLEALVRANKIELNLPERAVWLAEHLAWDLFDKAMIDIDRKSIRGTNWLSILMASAHQGWEKFETMYANVPVGTCPKWIVFCKSLSYSSLEWFSDRLISENENIKKNINTVDGYAALVLYSSGNDKFLKQVLGDASFLKFLKDSFNKIMNVDLPDKVVTALLSSPDFKNLVKEEISDDQAWNEFATALRSNVQKAKLIYGCFLLKPDPTQLDNLAGNQEGLAFLSEKFWDVYPKETKVKVLQSFIEFGSVKPLINVLARENIHNFKLSELETNRTYGRYKIFELASFFDCVEVDRFESQSLHCDVKLNLDTLKGIIESRNSVANSLRKGPKFNAWFYSWAAKYCLFHNDFNLMVELGRHMLLEDPQDQVISYAEVALKIAIFKLTPILVEDVRLLVCHFLFQDARDSMNLQN